MRSGIGVAGEEVATITPKGTLSLTVDDGIECPLVAMNGPPAARNRLPLCPRKRTWLRGLIKANQTWPERHWEGSDSAALDLEPRAKRRHKYCDFP
jgi:hypothetical protein